jgi:hypothetical protein
MSTSDCPCRTSIWRLRTDPEIVSPSATPESHANSNFASLLVYGVTKNSAHDHHGQNQGKTAEPVGRPAPIPWCPESLANLGQGSHSDRRAYSTYSTVPQGKRHLASNVVIANELVPCGVRCEPRILSLGRRHQFPQRAFRVWTSPPYRESFRNNALVG